MLPADTRFSLKTACRHYADYEHCEDVYGDNCTDTMKETQIFHTVFKPLCRENYKQYLSHLDCYRRMKKYFSTCRRKRRSKMPSGIQSSRGSYWCRITGDFITCMYSNIALGCSIEAANVYLTIMNKTIETLPHSGAPCAFTHPLDLLKTTSSPSASTSPLYMLRDAEQVSNGQYQSINPVHNSQGHICISVMFILIHLIFFSYANIL
ncbi:uncharacterized protein LOC121380515 [Gigantopelta aegis]|uniref:uncharacterized protein LOC121380515 n=1 Tax=Gigantopelta aegis TaxID=1735272 RepID=UPI001B88A767|nr:uncharacterized protein LOC121380515 [Gigantopelta aegis]